MGGKHGIVLLTLHVSWMNSNKPRLHLAGLPGPGLMGGWLFLFCSRVGSNHQIWIFTRKYIYICKCGKR